MMDGDMMAVVKTHLLGIPPPTGPWLRSMTSTWFLFQGGVPSGDHQNKSLQLHIRYITADVFVRKNYIYTLTRSFGFMIFEPQHM